MEELKEGWRRVKLLDYYEVTNGLSKNKSEFGFGYPFLTFKEVFNNYFLTENLVNLANSTVKEREKCSIKIGDIFITRTSETMEELGITAVALKDYPNATFNGFTKRLRPKSHAEISPEFISFYLKSKEFRNQIQSFSSLTTRASLNNEMLEKLELIIPDIHKQKEIAKILKNLYDKIEINNEMNKTFEEMAQTLFKRWFIDFDFPNENGEPYRSSGGKMVDSELGEIPEGWMIKNLGSICETTSGGTPSRKKEEYYLNGHIHWIKSKELNGHFIIDTEEKITDNALKESSAKLLPKNTILIAMYGATVGEVGITPMIASCNQAICAIKENEKIPYFFIYEYFKENKEKVKNLAIGSAQQNISQILIKNLKIIVPIRQIMENYVEVTKNLYDKILQNQLEIQSLTQIRDTLLPKLMSGEVEV